MTSSENHPRRCTATNRAGQRCGRWAIKGGSVCKNHGGAAPQVAAKANERLQIAAANRSAARAIATLGQPITTEPVIALLEEVNRAAGSVHYLGLIVAALDPAAVVWGRTMERDDDTRGAVIEHRAEINMWVQLWTQERDRLVRAAKAALDAGISERLVAIESTKAQILATLITAIIDDTDLGLDDQQRTTARHVAARHLRALPTGD
jgi:hypothetical protein